MYMVKAMVRNVKFKVSRLHVVRNNKINTQCVIKKKVSQAVVKQSACHEKISESLRERNTDMFYAPFRH